MNTKEVLQLAVTRLRVPRAKLEEFERLATADRSPEVMKALGLAMEAKELADRIEAFVARTDGVLR